LKKAMKLCVHLVNLVNFSYKYFWHL